MNQEPLNTAIEEYADVFTASADYAARFSGSAGEYMLAVQERAVASVLGPYASASLLDVGGGHGQLLDLYQRLNMRVLVHGSSPLSFNRLSPYQIEKMARIVSSPIMIPLPEKSVDVVVSVRLLSHMAQWAVLIREMCRIARHAVVIDYPSTRSLNVLGPMFFGMKKKVEKNTRAYLSFNRKELESCFQQHGFSVFASRPQFVIPMVVHRMGSGSGVLRATEWLSAKIMLTQWLGSPVIMRASVQAPRAVRAAAPGR